MNAVLDNYDLVLRAFGYTLMLFVLAGIGSLLFGSFLAALRVGPVSVMRSAVSIYVTLVRNTPLLVVLIFFRIAGPKVGLSFGFIDVQVGGVNLNAVFTACLVGLIVYTSAFVCEALRSGINAVSLGQAEAARAIGLTFGQNMTNVVLPQAFRAVVPPMASVLIALTKNTSVAAAFGLLEATARMRGFTNNNADDRTLIFLTFAIGYIIIVEVMSAGAFGLERRWRVSR